MFRRWPPRRAQPAAFESKQTARLNGTASDCLLPCALSTEFRGASGSPDCRPRLTWPSRHEASSEGVLVLAAALDLV